MYERMSHISTPPALQSLYTSATKYKLPATTTFSPCSTLLSASSTFDLISTFIGIRSVLKDLTAFAMSIGGVGAIHDIEGGGRKGTQIILLMLEGTEVEDDFAVVDDAEEAGDEGASRGSRIETGGRGNDRPIISVVGCSSSGRE